MEKDRSRLSLGVRVFQIVVAIFALLAIVALLRGECLTDLGSWKWLVGGGGSTVALLLVLSGCMVGLKEKKENPPPQVKPPRSVEEPKAQVKTRPIKSKPLLPNASEHPKKVEAASGQKKLERILDNWVIQAPKEHDSRTEAKRRILLCFESNCADLTLSHLGLTSLPFNALYSLKLDTLFLSDNQLATVPAEIFNPEYFPSLKILDLSNNSFSSLPLLSDCSNLNELHLSGNQFSEVPPAIKFFFNLKKLNLSNNKISFFEATSLNQLKKLEKLIIGDNLFLAFDETLSLPRLKELSLRNFKGSELKIKAEDFPKMTKLTVNDSESLQKISFAGNFQNLKFLGLENNQIHTFEIESARFLKLTTLDLSKNQFSNFDQIACLYSLHSEHQMPIHASIYLAGNQFAHQEVQEYEATFQQMKSNDPNAYPEIHFTKGRSLS